jgi:hypothetical protein
MSYLWTNQWFKRLGAAAVVVLGLVAVALPTAPAQARVWVGVSVPFFSVGVGAPGYYYPYYYGHPAYYHPGWRSHSWCYHHPYRCHW